MNGSHSSSNGITRRRFVQGLRAGGRIAAVDLELEAVAVNVTGRPGVATAINSSAPAPADMDGVPDLSSHHSRATALSRERTLVDDASAHDARVREACRQRSQIRRFDFLARRRESPPYCHDEQQLARRRLEAME